MTSLPVHAITAISHSLSKNGKGNTLKGAAILAGIAVLYNLIRVVFKILIDNNKAKNAIKLEEIKSVKKERLLKLKAENTIKVENAKAANKEHLANIKAEAAANKGCREEVFDTDIKVAPMPSLDDILAMPDTKREDMILMYGFVPKGGSLVICGPTNVGKTTFNIQLALQLVTGKCDYPLAPNFSPVKPQKVLLFSTEQSKKTIKHDYKALGNQYPNFKIETEGVSPEEILAKVKLELETADSEGIVVDIDNYTKLIDAYGDAEVKWLDRQLEELRRKNENTKPVTLIKIVHTNKKYKEYNPVDIQHIDGKSGIANFTHNLIFLTACGKGHDYRILKERKNKIDGTKDTVSILTYAGTDPHQFVYNGEAVEEEALPSRHSRKSKADEEEAPILEPGKRGPKEKYSEAELLEMYEEHEAKFTWREILEIRGLEFSKDKVKGIREAMKRHNIRA